MLKVVLQFKDSEVTFESSNLRVSFLIDTILPFQSTLITTPTREYYPTQKKTDHGLCLRCVGAKSRPASRRMSKSHASVQSDERKSRDGTNDEETKVVVRKSSDWKKEVFNVAVERHHHRVNSRVEEDLLHAILMPFEPRSASATHEDVTTKTLRSK